METAYRRSARRPGTRAAARAAGDRLLLAPARAHARHHLSYPGKVRSLGSTAYHVALVARGMAEAALVAQPRVWDLAAPGAVLEAVGGRYEYLGGGLV